MDLLLQAAKVLESERPDDDGSDLASASSMVRSARGAISYHQHQYSRRSRDDDNENTNLQLQFSDNSRSSLDDGLSNDRRRTGGGAGTREVHNQLEKNRRKQLRECFNHLQQCVPSLENKRVATQSILQGAIKFIKHLKKKDVEQERDIQTLAKRKSDLKKMYDQERNKCSEDEQRLAEVILKAAHARLANNDVEEDDGHTSDSTTTASEGPGNEDDELSDDDMGPEARYSITSFDGSRKRKAGGQRHDLGRNHGSIIRQSGSSKPHTSSAVSSTSSVALKQMLEQRKKQQIAVSSQGATSTPTVSKSSHKAHSSLKSSYPMISGHLASTMKPNKTATPPVQHLPNPQMMPVFPKRETIHSNYPAFPERMSPAPPLTQFTDRVPLNLSSIRQHLSAPSSTNSSSLFEGSFQASPAKSRKLDEPRVKVEVVQPAISVPSVFVNSMPNMSLSGQVNLGGASPYSIPTSLNSVKTTSMQPVTTHAMFPSSFSFFPSQLQSLANTSKPDGKRDVYFSSPLKIPGAYNMGDNKMNNNVSSSLQNQLAATRLMEAALPNSKILPVIPANLAPHLVRLPISSLAVSLQSGSSSDLGNRGDASNHLTSSNMTASHYSIKTESNQVHINPSLTLAGKNTRIATLLAAPSTPTAALRTQPLNLTNLGVSNTSFPMGDAHKGLALHRGLIPMTASTSPSTVPTASINLSSAHKMMSLTPTLFNPQHMSASSSLPTATITLSDAQKNGTLTPTLLPLSLTSAAHMTSSAVTPATSSVISSATPIRFLAPLTQSMLANGQAHLMPMLQLGSSGLILQNILQAQHPLLQPILVMTSPSPLPSPSQPVAAGPKATPVTSPSQLL